MGRGYISVAACVPRDHEEEEVWFQQDEATAHTARRSMEMLRELFPGRLVSLRGDIS